MTDDPLAHLYYIGDEPADEDELEDLEHFHKLASSETSLDALTAAVETGPEVLSDHDLDELALLVEFRLDGGGLPDADAAELGLGSLEEAVGADLDRELVLNDVGRAVLRRVMERRGIVDP